MPAATRAARTGDLRRPLEAAEAALLVITCGHLCFLPWALGTMHVWSQATSLLLSLAGVALALLARRKDRTAIRRAYRHPALWAALAWLGYMALQAANPAWTYAHDGTSWWLDPRSSLRWLPSGVDAPFALSNPLRVLMVHATLLLLAASVWFGLRRRRSHLILLSALSGNALLLALLGLVQRWDGTARIFWSYWSSNDRFIASFIYPNHAGPYFYLMTALSAGLAWRFLQRRGHAPAALAVTFSAAASGVLVLHTQSRLSVALLAVLSIGFVVALGVRALRRPAPAQKRRLRPVVITLALAGLVTVPVATPAARQVWSRFQEARPHGTTIGADRRTAWVATREMVADRPLLGHGAGSFRHVFPLYAQHHPSIYETPNGVRRYWDHAHNDWLEFTAEMGALGLLPAVVCLAWLARRLRRSGFQHNSVSLALVIGCALPPVHAGADFVFQNPAVLFTWLVLLLAAIRLGELDRPRPAA